MTSFSIAGMLDIYALDLFRSQSPVAGPILPRFIDEISVVNEMVLRELNYSHLIHLGIGYSVHAESLFWHLLGMSPFGNERQILYLH